MNIIDAILSLDTSFMNVKFGFKDMVKETIDISKKDSINKEEMICAIYNAGIVTKNQLKTIDKDTRDKYCKALINISNRLSSIATIIVNTCKDVNKEENPDYENMTKEELIKILKSKR